MQLKNTAGKCLIPTNLRNFVEIGLTNNESNVNMTSSLLLLRCKDGFISDGLGVLTAVCSINGTWSPDPEQFMCHSTAINTTGNKHS